MGANCRKTPNKKNNFFLDKTDVGGGFLRDIFDTDVVSIDYLAS